LEPDSIALINPVAVEVFLIIDDDDIYYCKPRPKLSTLFLFIIAIKLMDKTKI
jgi:hypothetical protein